ncbi:MAG: hypothetical protein CVT61_01930 [Actinobacteria bacterium HGW-Actinobacteria-11]|nr:MAG: hypothetical protein CVT61_01930 [Actinobacteria bacterium HGW-Actinobacteria-11]
MSDAAHIRSYIGERGITRVTHFTNSRNLPGILDAGAILPTSRLPDGVGFHANTDEKRIDGRLDHICCSIEYPNAFYFRRATGRTNQINYTDWIVLLLEPHLLAREGVLFAPSNAAVARGAMLRDGLPGMKRLFEDKVRDVTRSSAHRIASPTDVQAEALIPDEISVSAITGIVVPSVEALKREFARLPIFGYDPEQFDWYVSKDMFDWSAVTSAVRQGTVVAMTGPIRTTSEVDE